MKKENQLVKYSEVKPGVVLRVAPVICLNVARCIQEINGPKSQDILPGAEITVVAGPYLVPGSDYPNEQVIKVQLVGRKRTYECYLRALLNRCENAC